MCHITCRRSLCWGLDGWNWDISERGEIYVGVLMVGIGTYLNEKYVQPSITAAPLCVLKSEVISFWCRMLLDPAVIQWRAIRSWSIQSRWEDNQMHCMLLQAASIELALPITCLFPFMYFMVRDFHIAKTEQNIGFYTGVLAASYMVGRGFTAIFWGILADRIGRKPVIAFSILSVVVFNTLFGLSTSYWMAIALRLVLGALNGLLAPIKAYCVEVCQAEHQALGLSLLLGQHSLGFGCHYWSISWWLPCTAADKYPNTFPKRSIFGRFPYLLPCLSVSTFAAIVLIGCKWLPETIHRHKLSNKDTKEVKSLLPREEGRYWKSPRTKSLFQNRPWMSTMLPYCFFSLHDGAYSEILSIWAVSERKYGGLSFSTADIGEVLAVAGASLLIYQLIIYHWVHNILGTVNSSRIAAAVSILVLAIYPFMTYLHGLKLSFALYSAAAMKSALAIIFRATYWIRWWSRLDEEEERQP